eukprot:g54718.t1
MTLWDTIQSSNHRVLYSAGIMLVTAVVPYLLLQVGNETTREWTDKDGNDLLPPNMALFMLVNPASTELYYAINVHYFGFLENAFSTDRGMVIVIVIVIAIALVLVTFWSECGPGPGRPPVFNDLDRRQARTPESFI